MQKKMHIAVIAFIATVMAMTIPSLAQDSELWGSNIFNQDSGWSFDRFDLGESLVWDSDYFAQPQYLAAARKGGGGSSGGPPLKPDGTIDLEAISKSMDNPLGSLWIIFTQNDTITLRGPPFRKTQVANVFTLMPILPVPLTKDWILVNRPIMSFINLNTPDTSAINQGAFPDLFAGGGSAFGGLPSSIPTTRRTEFGDFIFWHALAPRDLPDFLNGKFIWGVGPSVIYPTATHSALGSDKWSAGPGILGMYMGQGVKVGGLVQHWNSFAGPGDRPDVSKSNIQPLVYFDLGNLWQIGTSPNILINWEAGGSNKYTLPIGGAVNKTLLLFGKLPTRFEVAVYWSAVKPDGVGQDWLFRFNFIPVIPNPLKAMGIDSLF